MEKSENSEKTPFIEITHHAYKRAKERYQWPAKVLDKMAEKAYFNGIKHSQAKGSFKKYLDKLWHQHKHTNNIRIYGEDIYFFTGNLLITLYQLPNNMRKHTKRCK
ncbi:hypothetical protein J2810_004598 [Chryseobacterium rhizosphaerae]|uniref:hypothetical protein n=1 Tax=Chryseobacterium rhizosphaerae TaxID=395937 RepID=UPI00286382C9|nr:hypothetical protein [Chryseobacterium rhizosphaerae]MDR6548508.1 hypothetical protein [Chryseobacterium rhizosphaerae]